ncbi:MAG TPA: hypothetical protein VH083_11720 [Myxococcales bacterium]|nr:hypothetical protein [Myxococcales bacterium]
MLRFALAFALFVAIVAAAWLFWPRRAARERLLDDIIAEEKATDARPSHVQDPLPESFGVLLAPHLAALHDSYVAYQEIIDKEAPEAPFYNDEVAISGLRPRAAADLDQHRAAMLGALRATHGSTARSTPELSIFRLFEPGSPSLDVQQAARLAALDILIKAKQGRADEAATECADALALGRDISYPSVLGRMLGVANTGIVAKACARAIAETTPAAAATLSEQLAVIRRGTPRFALTLRRESIFQRVGISGNDPRLPDEARRLGASFMHDGDALKATFFRESSWWPAEGRMNGYQAAQSLPFDACLARMAEVHDSRLYWHPYLGAGDGFAALLKRHHDGLSKLDVLQCLATLRAGKLCAPVEPDATCGEQAAPLAISADAVSVKLSDGTLYSLPVAPPKH